MAICATAPEQKLIQAKDALERKTEELAYSLSMMQATLDSDGTFALVEGFEDATLLSYSLISQSSAAFRSAKDVPQFVFRSFQNTLLLLRKILARAIDVEVQHRHGGLIRRAFAPLAGLSRAFQRERDLTRLS